MTVKKPSRVVNEHTDFYFSESSHLNFFTARYNSLLKKKFSYGNFSLYVLGVGKFLSFSRSRAIYKESNRFQFLSLLQQQRAVQKATFLMIDHFRGQTYRRW